MTYYLSTEIFSIPYKDKYIVYAPLKQTAFMVSPMAVNLLYKINLENNGHFLNKEEKELLTTFRELGLIDGAIDKLPARTEETFAPTNVTLFLTGKCNLRCIYCYASGGEKENSTIPLKMAKSAIDLIIKNALSKNQKVIGVGFHGGGEPTLAWQTLVKCVEYTKSRSLATGLKINFSIASNGVISAKRLDWIMDNFTGLNLSLDGTEDIQNYHRPLANGKGSYKKVIDTVKRMNDRNFSYGVRATVTARSVANLDKYVEFFGIMCKTKNIHFEPTFACGRCLYTGIEAPSPDEFIAGYRKAQKVAEKLGISIYYSGARINTISTIFCKASGDSFCVTPQGDVTSCYEVCSKDDLRSEVFFYGKYDNEEKEFIFYENKLAYLRKRTINNIPHCENCFCKYHCAGDCLAKASDGMDLMSINNPNRCKINQTLTLDGIIKILEGVGRVNLGS
ncbi:MAG: radical SAM protein [Nitrospirae bacterium]|nr:radical SAM protein [Nitrospirota bacterium]